MPGPSMRQAGSHGAFTVIELMIAMAVIALLSGLTLAVFPRIRAQQHIAATQALVHAVANAVNSHADTTFSVTEVVAVAGGGRDTHERRYRLWDWNGDGILDGDPQRIPAVPVALRQAADAGGYGGFVASGVAAIPSARVDPATGRVLDAWRRPLRIAFRNPLVAATDIYDGLHAGVWSLGPNRANGQDLGEADGPYAAEAARQHRHDPQRLLAEPALDNIVSWGR